jgi:molybdate transport system substrate-binding protein
MPGAWIYTAAGVVSMISMSSCSAHDNAASNEITVFAASSLTAAFTEIGEAFEQRNPGITVTFNFAASSELVTQIGDGAPADVFASADLITMSTLVETGNADGASQTFATNAAAIIVEPGNPFGITSLSDLADPDLIVVTCAPEVPCGRYAATVMGNAGLTIVPKSLEENAKAVVAKVTLGEADAGIVYRTDVIAAGPAATGIEIPDDLNVLAEYPIVTLTGAPNPAGGAAFVAFVTSADGQAVLQQSGFDSP